MHAFDHSIYERNNGVFVWSLFPMLCVRDYNQQRVGQEEEVVSVCVWLVCGISGSHCRLVGWLI